MDLGKGPKWLNNRWPAEIDVRGMVKSSRMPLGYAAKEFVEAGYVDRNGHVAKAAEEGWYYLWFRGIHMLCGFEGEDSYQHRPAYEDMLGNLFYFDINFPCRFQEAQRG